MTNPFDPSSTPPSGGPAGPHDLDISLAINDATGALSRNVVPWIGVALVAFFATIVAIMLCFVPVFIVAPLLGWGITLFTLRAVDGTAGFDALTDAFDNAVPKWVVMIVIMLLLFVVQLPAVVVSLLPVISDLIFESVVLSIIVNLVASLLQLAYTLIITPRFALATFYAVDQKLDGLEAVKRSWEVTAPVWSKMILLYVIEMIASFVGLMLCIVGIIPASLFSSALNASAYRQLTGTRTA